MRVRVGDEVEQSSCIRFPHASHRSNDSQYCESTQASAAIRFGQPGEEDEVARKGIALAAVTALIVGVVSAAAAGRAGARNEKQHSIAGAWLVTVSRPGLSPLK